MGKNKLGTRASVSRIVHLNCSKLQVSQANANLVSHYLSDYACCHSMTDGRDNSKLLLYFYRAAVNRNRPVCIANHMGGRRQVERQRTLQELEDRGLATLFSEDSIYKEIEDAIPNSLGKTEQEIQAMPKFVRNYKCGNLIEMGDPYCGAEKFNETFCAQRRGKAKWHQGWYVIVLDVFGVRFWFILMYRFVSRTPTGNGTLFRATLLHSFSLNFSTKQPKKSKTAIWK